MKIKLLKKIVAMTRFGFYGFILQCICVSLLIADDGLAQQKSVFEIYLSVQIEEGKLVDAFKLIEYKTGFNFSYNDAIIEENRYVSLNMPYKSLGDVLGELSKNTNLKFRRVNQNIHVSTKEFFQQSVVEEIEPVQNLIKGKVTSSENGEPLPGVSILVRGTSIGTTTDLYGNYSLTVDNNAVLQFSFIGYKTQEIQIDNQSTIDIVLEQDLEQLEEIVVVGYGTTKKSDLTGSVSSVKPKDIRDLAMPSLDQAIQGRAAGVFVSRTSGAPGAGAEIFIRGVGSIQGTDPLWIIDGVRTSPGTNFNMNDVASIEILKDASAAAIYGSAAANGVIIVTTKRGEKGEPKLSFNSYAGVSSALGLPEPLNTEQYAEIKNEAYDLAGDPRIPAYADPNNLPPVSTDWLDVLYGNGSIQSYDLSVSGGNEKSNFFISGSYFREEGTHVDSDFERYSVRANSDFNLGERFKIGESILLSHSIRDPVNAANRDWIRATPALPVFDPANRFGGFGTVDRLEYQYEGGNPLASELRTDEINKDYRINGNIYLEAKIIKGLSFRTNLGANLNFGNDRTFVNTYLGGGGVLRNTASLTQEYDENIRILGNALLTYDKEIEKHRFKVVAGYEAIRTDINRYSASGANFSGNLQVLDGADPDSRDATGREFSDRIVSQFGRIDYSYNDKYLFTVNIRRDGSSLFGENERYGVFPSASVGWRLVNEDFMLQLPFIS
ncbi:MAG: SusC/RagA family TonB-linked outer membrane protein, partial [Bacteroidota bacterium]